VFAVPLRPFGVDAFDDFRLRGGQHLQPGDDFSGRFVAARVIQPPVGAGQSDVPGRFDLVGILVNLDLPDPGPLHVGRGQHELPPGQGEEGGQQRQHQEWSRDLQETHAGGEKRCQFEIASHATHGEEGGHQHRDGQYQVDDPGGFEEVVTQDHADRGVVVDEAADVIQQIDEGKEDQGPEYGVGEVTQEGAEQQPVDEVHDALPAWTGAAPAR